MFTSSDRSAQSFSPESGDQKSSFSYPFLSDEEKQGSNTFADAPLPRSSRPDTEEPAEGNDDVETLKRHWGGAKATSKDMQMLFHHAASSSVSDDIMKGQDVWFGKGAQAGGDMLSGRLAIAKESILPMQQEKMGGLWDHAWADSDGGAFDLEPSGRKVRDEVTGEEREVYVRKLPPAERRQTSSTDDRLLRSMGVSSLTERHTRVERETYIEPTADENDRGYKEVLRL